jgi:membrane protein
MHNSEPQGEICKPTASARGGSKDHSIGDPFAQRIWDQVAQSPLGSLWNFEGVPPGLVLKRTLHCLINDDLFSRAAEMGYYFLFALCPMLICASSIMGLVARGTNGIYNSLLRYLALVVPPSAYALVIHTFTQTTAAATGGKVILGLAAALWSASVGFASIQDGMNSVYKIRESRPYWKARGSAILVTLLLLVMVTANLAALLGGDFLANLAGIHIWHHGLAMGARVGLHAVEWIVAISLLLLQFSTIYYFGPDLKHKRWHWLTPGAAIAMLGWIGASMGLKLYLRFFNSFSLTYGSLGAVIVLLTWFYITGLMLLLGAKINAEIQAAVTEQELKTAGSIPPEAEAEPETPAQPQPAL